MSSDGTTEGGDMDWKRMKQDGTIKLFQYWNRLRDGRPAPRRTEVEPADIKGLLGDTFILESDLRGEAVFRLAGTRLCAMYGRELKGFAFSSLWRDRDRRMVARLVRNVLTEQSVLVMCFEAISRSGRQVPVELLLLPLSGGEESRRALGVATPADKPYWLGADPVIDSALDSVRVVDPDRETAFPLTRPAIDVPTLAPGELPLDTAADAIAGIRRIRHLIVLPGGRT
jgi:hypothetical protein